MSPPKTNSLLLFFFVFFIMLGTTDGCAKLNAKNLNFENFEILNNILVILCWRFYNRVKIRLPFSYHLNRMKRLKFELQPT